MNNDNDYNTSNLNVCILLAAGTSSRFNQNQNQNISKQLYFYNGDKIINHSINLMINYCDILVIVTNSSLEQEINDVKKNSKKIHIVINDYNCRLESIEHGLKYIRANFPDVKNLIIHDSARPNVPDIYIKNLILMTKFKNHYYTQYCLRLSNGLYDLKNKITIDRDNFVEICTPICVKFDLYYFIFANFISKNNRYSHEPIDILKLYNIKTNFLFGQYKHLKKITWFDDIHN